MARLGAWLLPLLLTYHPIVGQHAQMGLEGSIVVFTRIVSSLFRKIIEVAPTKPSNVWILVKNTSPLVSHTKIDKISQEAFWVVPLRVSPPRMGRPSVIVPHPK